MSTDTATLARSLLPSPLLQDSGRLEDTTSALTEVEISTLGECIAADGLQTHRARIQLLAAEARAVCPVAAGVLGSEEEPEVARLRAFSVVASALVRKINTPAVQSHGTV